MARVVEEVLVGPGTLYLAADATAFPADPSVTPAGSWADPGYSEEGWSVTVDRNIEELVVAEEIDPIGLHQTKREIHLVGVMMQASLENVQEAFGDGAISTSAGPPATKTFTPGSTETITKRTALLRVQAPPVAGAAKVRDIKIPNVITQSAVELAYKKAPDAAKIAADFRVTKKTGSAILTITDLT